MKQRLVHFVRSTKFLVIAFILAALSPFAALYSLMISTPSLMGDSFDPDKIEKMSPISSLFGDAEDLFGDSETTDDDDDEDIDTLAMLGESFFGDVNDTSSAIILTGDVDAEEQQVLDTLSSILEGNAKKINRFGKRSRRADNIIKNVDHMINKRNNESLIAPRFIPGLAKQKMAAQLAKSFKDNPAALQSKLTTVNALSGVRGALTAMLALAPVSVAGGRLAISTTELKLDGYTLAEVVKLWKTSYPGLSRTSSAISTGAPVVFSFQNPSGQEITRHIPILLQFSANALTKIAAAYVGITVQGLLSDGTPFLINKDQVEIFTEGQLATKVMLIPYRTIKQRLHAVSAIADNTNPFVITLSGVPNGTQVVARLASEDDSEWNNYQKMIGLL